MAGKLFQFELFTPLWVLISPSCLVWSIQKLKGLTVLVSVHFGITERVHSNWSSFCSHIYVGSSRPVLLRNASCQEHARNKRF